MNQINFQNVCHSTNTTSNASSSEIVRELIAGHTVFQEKMIPEIEQHFLVLLVQADQQSAPTLATCFKQFEVFRSNLTDHIAMEESIVFPFLLSKDTQNSKETVEFFLTHHEDYEIQLHEMILNISAELAHLSHLLPFRLLIHKMNSFCLKMEEHGELEDVLFVM